MARYQYINPDWQNQGESGLRAAAERALNWSRFHQQEMGHPIDANRYRTQATDWNKQLIDQGWAGIDMEASLSPEMADKLWMDFASGGPQQSAYASMAQVLKGKHEAYGALDKAQGVVDQGPYAQLLAYVKSQLANPQVITDKTQKMIEGGFRTESNRASKEYETRLREQMGARGLPGRPALSGPGLHQLGGFEGELGGRLMDSLRESRIQQATLNRKYADDVQRLAADIVRADPSLQILFNKANIASGMPAQMLPAFSGYTSYMAADKARKDAGKDSPKWWESLISPAASLVGGLFGGPVGAVAGGAAGGAATGSGGLDALWQSLRL